MIDGLTIRAAVSRESSIVNPAIFNQSSMTRSGNRHFSVH
jgi:hypothetical protein